MVASAEPAGETMTAQDHASRVEVRHPLAIRWFHWLHFPILFTMIWSGLLIYWADTRPGQPAGQFYRIGFGDFTLVRLFPEWFYRPEINGFGLRAAAPEGHPLYQLDHRLAEGMAWHFLFMWLFAINGAAYVVFLAVSGQWRRLWPNSGSVHSAWQVVLHDLRLRRDAPPSEGYNAAQRLAYLLVVLMGAGSLATGLAIYKPTQLPWPLWLGGYEAARFLHFWLTMGFVAFFAVHVAQVARAGWSNFRAMITGRLLAGEDKTGG